MINEIQKLGCASRYNRFGPAFLLAQTSIRWLINDYITLNVPPRAFSNVPVTGIN